MSLHIAQVFISLSVIILPIINIYFLFKVYKILERFKEGS